MNRHAVRAYLRSDTFAIDATLVVLGVVLAGAMARVLVWDPGIGGPAVEVAPVPAGIEEWTLVGTFVFLAATAATLGARWLACVWLPFPSMLVAYVHFYTAASGSFVVAGLPTVVAVALVAAAIVGTTGYLFGDASREVYEQYKRVDLRIRPP